MQIERTYREDINEHVLTVDGREVATAHKVNIMWSVTEPGTPTRKLLGLAPSEQVAVAALDKIAAQFRKAA